MKNILGKIKVGLYTMWGETNKIVPTTEAWSGAPYARADSR